MTYLYITAAGFGLLIFQTTILSSFQMCGSLYDAPVLFILYLALFRPPREGCVSIIFLGMAMDVLSGGPFGLYLTAYTWLYVGVRWMTRYLHAGNRMLLPFVSVAGILIENLLFLGTTVVLSSGWPVLWHLAAPSLGLQMLWAALTGPFVIVFFFYTHKRWNAWAKALSTEKNGIGI